MSLYSTSQKNGDFEKETKKVLALKELKSAEELINIKLIPVVKTPSPIANLNRSGMC